MKVQRRPFGAVDGQTVELFTLTNSAGMEVSITNFGGSLVRWLALDKEGKLADVVLGFDSVEGYQNTPGYLGALVGRYANRIAGAYFELNGRGYHLAKNDGDNHLHGGERGFSHRVWDALVTGDASLTLTYFSPHGEENYPGNLQVKVVYTLRDTGELVLEYTVKQTRIPSPTSPITLFQPGRARSGSIPDHVVRIYADQYVPGCPVHSLG